MASVIGYFQIHIVTFPAFILHFVIKELVDWGATPAGSAEIDGFGCGKLKFVDLLPAYSGISRKIEGVLKEICSGNRAIPYYGVDRSAIPRIDRNPADLAVKLLTAFLPGK